MNLHYAVFTLRDGHMWELDGRKNFPVDHGPSSRDTLLQVGCRCTAAYGDTHQSGPLQMAKMSEHHFESHGFRCIMWKASLFAVALCKPQRDPVCVCRPRVDSCTALDSCRARCDVAGCGGCGSAIHCHHGLHPLQPHGADDASSVRLTRCIAAGRRIEYESACLHGVAALRLCNVRVVGCITTPDLHLHPSVNKARSIDAMRTSSLCAAIAPAVNCAEPPTLWN